MFMRTEKLKQEIINAIDQTPEKEVIKSISLFGSFLHGDDNENSDIDLLIDFQKPAGYFTLIGIQQELEKRLGRRVDLVTRGALSRYFRDSVIKEAERIYVA